jgi:hypothetical protein
MRRTLNAALLGLASMAVLPGTAAAVPLLQLDIAGGYYDTSTQTIIASGPVFTLTAVLTPSQNATATDIANLLNDTFYISAAVTPQYGPTDGGSFVFNGQTVDVIGDMVYGTPPMDTPGLIQTTDPGDLAPHAIYPTYFSEFGFQFSPVNRALEYNTADNPGGLTPSATGTSYYANFSVDTRLLDPSYAIHFDLYDTFLRNCSRNLTASGCTDVDIDHFAPFSHDAQSPPVPEPASMLLLGSGIGAGVLRRLRRKTA